MANCDARFGCVLGHLRKQTSVVPASRPPHFIHSDKASKKVARLIHGDKDEIVSLRCGRQYLEAYGDNAELMVEEGENHMISKKLAEVKGLVVDFFVSLQAQ
jgi:hypothetical protein